MSTPVPAEGSPSVWEDLLEIFYAPTAVFERRRNTPAFGLALVIFAIISVAMFFAFRNIMAPMMDADIKRGMVQAMKTNPQITPEMIGKIQDASRKWAVFGIGLATLILPMLTGMFAWLVGKVVDSKAEFGQMMLVGTYAWYPRVLEGIVNAVQLLVLPEESIKGRFSVSLGPARFLDPDQVNPFLLAIVGRLDFFTLWVTVLLGIGLSVMGKIPKGRAMIAAALMWLIGAIPALFQAMRQG